LNTVIFGTVTLRDRPTDHCRSLELVEEEEEEDMFDLDSGRDN
jgi:hypothetical protein